MFKQFIQLYEDYNEFMCFHELPQNGPGRMNFVKFKDADIDSYAGKENVFFAPNSLGYRYDKSVKKSHLKRDREHLQRLHCLYVDIDIKDSTIIDFESPEQAYEYFNYHCLKGEVPEPTMITCSGSGIHMFWKIDPVTYKGNLEKYDAAMKYIYDVFKAYGADSRVSKDRVRLMRVPGTLNVKGNKVKEAYTMAFSGKKYTLDGFCHECNIDFEKVIQFKKEPKEVKTPEKIYYQETSKVLSFYTQIYSKRINDLTHLLLKHRDFESTGKKTAKRENILFLLRYYFLESGCSLEEALEKVKEINARLKYPLTEKEVIKSTKSAEKYHQSQQKKLRMTNRSLIEFLSITEEEQMEMKTIMSAEEKALRKKRRDRKAYLLRLEILGKDTKAKQIMERRISIQEMLKNGQNQREICTRLNISRSTFYEDFGAIKSEEWQRESQEYMESMMEPMEATGTDNGTAVFAGKIVSPKNSAPVIICDVCSSIPPSSPPSEIIDLPLEDVRVINDS